MEKGIKKALSMLMTVCMMAGLFAAMPPSVAKAENGDGVTENQDSYRQPEVDCIDEMNISENGTYLVVADWVEWGDNGPDHLNEEATYHGKWYISYGEMHPVSLALVTAHKVSEEGEEQWEWRLSENDIPVDKITVKTSDGNEEAAIWDTWGNRTDNEQEMENEYTTFLFYEEGEYVISYEKNGIKYELPVETTAPEMGFYAQDSITSENIFMGEKRHSDKNQKVFWAGLALNSDEVENFRIVTEWEEGKEDWEYSYCEANGIRVDVEKFLTMGEQTGSIAEGSVMIPFEIKTPVPEAFWLNLAVELTYVEEGRAPEVHTCGIEVINSNKENILWVTDWIDWSEDGEPSINEEAEYRKNLMTGLGGENIVSFRRGVTPEPITDIENLKLKDEDGNELPIAVFGINITAEQIREEQITEEQIRATYAAMLWEENVPGIIGIQFLKMGNFYLCYEEASLFVHVGLPELGIYTRNEFSEDTFAWGGYELRSDAVCILGCNYNSSVNDNKEFWAGLALDSDEVAGYRILMEKEDGKEEWEYSFCEVEGERFAAETFLEINKKSGNLTSNQEMIPITIKNPVPSDFWLHLAVELIYNDENRSPEVRTCDIEVINPENKLQVTDWIDWEKEEPDEQAEYRTNLTAGLTWGNAFSFQRWKGSGYETITSIEKMKLKDMDGKELPVVVLEKGEELTEEQKKNATAIFWKINDTGSIVGIIFLKMGNFYLCYEDYDLFARVGLPELGFYTDDEFSESTFTFDNYCLRSDAQTKDLYVRIETGDWHLPIQDEDVEISIYRDEDAKEAERKEQKENYIKAFGKTDDSEENAIVYKITLKDKVPGSFLMEVKVNRTDRNNNEDASIYRRIWVEYEEVPAKLTGIRITKQPLKTTYTVGETFDKTGMVVTADYDDGTTKVITDYTVNPSRSFTASDKSVTISYEGKSAALNITVKEKTPEKVPEKKPAKQKGANIEQDSMKYTVTDANVNGTGTVAYTGTTNKEVKTIKIPAVITDSETGVTYKVTSIKKNALKNSKALTSVTIGSNVTKIEEGAFSSCKKLKKITIPGSVTSIGKSAFKSCSALTTVTIGKKVISIGGSAFSGCKNLKSITIKSTVLKTVGSNAFKGINSKATIKVPSKKKSAYKRLIINKGKAPKKVKIK